MIGGRIFLWSEPRNAIACHQTLVQGWGTRLYMQCGVSNGQLRCPVHNIV